MPKGDHNRKLSEENLAEMIRMYVTPNDDGTWIGVPTIARRFGVANSCVQYHLRRAEVGTRSAREAHSGGKRCKPVKNLPTGSAPLCKCGCGLVVGWNQRKNRWNVYVVGHYRDPPGGIPKRLKRPRLRKAFIGPRPKPKYRGSPGAKNGSWKGGVTPERQRLYRSVEWKELLQLVWQRDDYRCVRCGADKTGRRKLHTHHVKSWAEHPELRMESDNLVTLCNVCHLWVHSKRNVLREFIG